MRLLRLVALVLLLPRLAGAVEPDERLADEGLEARARSISAELRCLVCQNQSIDDSAAPLARDLRLAVRARLSAGDSDAQAIAFVTQRYGDYVLLRPPFQANTWALWLGPALLLVAGALGLGVFFARQRRSATAPSPLTDEERGALERLAGGGTAP